MEKLIKNAIEEYQCSGCMSGCDITCFESDNGGSGCGKHYAGTMFSGGGGLTKIFLGMPKGFNRLGENKTLRPRIFKNWEQLNSEWEYDMWNIPFWKHLTKDGRTMVRGFQPRICYPFIHIILEDCMDKIDCREISKEEINAMD